jgi:hypothetical protein
VPVISLVEDCDDSIMSNAASVDDSDWHRETWRDLGRASVLLDSLVSSVSGSLSREQVHDLWLSYLLVEKSVAFIKIELDEENPGRFIKQKPYEVPDERQAIGFALRHLKLAIDSFDAGGLGTSLKDLRESRNYLRVLLKRVRRQRLKRRGAV